MWTQLIYFYLTTRNNLKNYEKFQSLHLSKLTVVEGVPESKNFFFPFWKLQIYLRSVVKEKIFVSRY